MYSVYKYVHVHVHTMYGAWVPITTASTVQSMRSTSNDTTGRLSKGQT